MGPYSKDIIQINDVYIIKNYNIAKMIFCYFILIWSNIFAFACISGLITLIKDKGVTNYLFSIISFFIFYISYFVASNDIKKIVIKINKGEITFRYRLIPFIRIKKIDINKLKEISINYTAVYINMFGRGRIKEKLYNIDLIDNKLYSYRIYQSEVYNDELINFSKELSKIINIGINDQNNVEGYKNIFIKNII